MTDYITKAMRTKADTYFPRLLPQELFNDIVLDVVNAGQMMERAKKALFYGKDTAQHENLRGYYGPKPIVDDENNQIRHAIMGVVGEAAELANLLQDPAANSKRMIDEAGDILWYLALLFDELGVTFEEVQGLNISKLTKRYPEKFTTDLAINRDVEKEAAVFS